MSPAASGLSTQAAVSKVLEPPRAETICREAGVISASRTTRDTSLTSVESAQPKSRSMKTGIARATARLRGSLST